MPAHSYRVNNCGNVDLLLDKFVFNTPPGIKHIADLSNFGVTGNFTGKTSSVRGIVIPPNQYKNFTVDYEYVSGPACCRYGSIVISSLSGKTNTIFTTISISDDCLIETVIANCSLTPAQTVLTFELPALPAISCSIVPNQTSITFDLSTVSCSLFPNQAVWSVPLPAVPVPAPQPAPEPPPPPPPPPPPQPEPPQPDITCSLTPNQLFYSVPIPAIPAPPVITCSLSPNWGTWSVTIPSGTWSIVNGSQTTQTGGSTFTFNWTAPSTAVGRRVSWFVVRPGTTTAFSDNGIGSSFVGARGNLPILSSQSGTINIQTNNITGNSQFFQVIIVEDNLGSTVLARSATCTISIPVTKTYRFTELPTPYSVTEGTGSAVFTVETTNVADGTTLWWAINPIGGTTAADFSTPFEGSVVINGGRGQISTLPDWDFNTPESGEAYTVRLYTSEANKNSRVSWVAESSRVDITDYPLVKTYRFSSPAITTSVNEGASITFTVTTTNVTNNTVLWWAAFGVNGASPEDASSPTPPQGSITIQNNQASLTVGVAQDLITPETGEAFTIRLYDSEASRNNYGIGLAESVLVNIRDIPPPVPTYTFSSPTSDTSVNEGDSITFIITTTNVSNGTILWWAAFGIGGATIPDVQNPTPPQGAVTISNNQATITIVVARDVITPEFGEAFNLRLYNSESSRNLYGTGLAQSVTVTINDIPPSGGGGSGGSGGNNLQAEN